MKKELVKTSNYERFRGAVAAVERRGAPEASMLLVVGHPGVSKSIIVNRWAVDTRAVYLRAKVDWTPARFLGELAEEMRVESGGRRKEVFARVVAAIGRTQVPLIIDEVQHALANGARTLEAVRDITDLTETIVVLVAGEDRVPARIARYPQIASRIARVVEFHEASVDDVAKSCRDLAEVEILPDLVQEIHRQSGGLMRHVVNAIALVEQDAKRNGKRKVGAADFAGKALVVDWQAHRRAQAASPARH
jgi:DNA transposition AAA+ family ATPase